jgi:hypothetical protein
MVGRTTRMRRDVGAVWQRAQQCARRKSSGSTLAAAVFGSTVSTISISTASETSCTLPELTYLQMAACTSAPVLLGSREQRNAPRVRSKAERESKRAGAAHVRCMCAVHEPRASPTFGARTIRCARRKPCACTRASHSHCARLSR